MNVEGHEEEVISGAEKLLRHDQPVFMVEIEEWHNPGGLSRLASQFSNMGYRAAFLMERKCAISLNLMHKDIKAQVGTPTLITFSFFHRAPGCIVLRHLSSVINRAARLCRRRIMQLSAGRYRFPRSTWDLRLTLLAVMLSTAVADPSSAAAPEPGLRDSGYVLGRGMNLAAALEAPKEGAWGVTLKSEYFETIRDAGFRSVRIPIRWSAHVLSEAPYTIDPQFFARIDWAVGEALSRSMNVVIDMHHYDDLYKDPDGQFARLAALWDQIGSHYHNFSQGLFFELVNEPFGELTDERWQAMLPELLRIVRQTNLERMIIVGPGAWISLDHLNGLHLPDSDNKLVATFHYYAPGRFTHQGASWVRGADQWKNVTLDRNGGRTRSHKDGF